MFALVNDARFEMRLRHRTAGVTEVAVTKLVSSIGTTSAFLTVTNAVVSRPSSYSEPKLPVVMRNRTLVANVPPEYLQRQFRRSFDRFESDPYVISRRIPLDFASHTVIAMSPEVFR